MKLNDPKILLEILNIAIDAGKEILKIYNDDITVKSKEDNSEFVLIIEIVFL